VFDPVEYSSRPSREVWGHDFVQAQFNGQLINRRKLYPVALRSTLNQNYILREKADYTTVNVRESRATQAVERVVVGGNKPSRPVAWLNPSILLSRLDVGRFHQILERCPRRGENVL
jgi:hypothetical protein